MKCSEARGFDVQHTIPANEAGGLYEDESGLWAEAVYRDLVGQAKVPPTWKYRPRSLSLEVKPPKSIVRGNTWWDPYGIDPHLYSPGMSPSAETRPPSSSRVAADLYHTILSTHQNVSRTKCTCAAVVGGNRCQIGRCCTSSRECRSGFIRT